MRWTFLIAFVLALGCQSKVRVPTVAVSAQVPASEPHCDGSFNGSGTVTATYPPPPPNNTVSSTTTLSVIDKTDVSASVDPNTASFANASAGPASFGITGNLADVCKDGKFTVRGSHVAASSPPQTTVSSSNQVTVTAVGFKIKEGVDVEIINNASFNVKTTLSCCAAPAGQYVIEESSKTNVKSLAWTPAPPQLTCPGPDVAFVAAGVKEKEEEQATVQLRVKRVADGKKCALGTAIVEGR